MNSLYAHTAHRMSKFLPKNFCKQLKICEICEIKDLRKLCAIRYCLVNFQVHNFPSHLPLKMVVHTWKYVEIDTNDVKHTPSILSLSPLYNFPNGLVETSPTLFHLYFHLDTARS